MLTMYTNNSTCIAFSEKNASIALFVMLYDWKSKFFYYYFQHVLSEFKQTEIMAYNVSKI